MVIAGIDLAMRFPWLMPSLALVAASVLLACDSFSDTATTEERPVECGGCSIEPGPCSCDVEPTPPATEIPQEPPVCGGCSLEPGPCFCGDVTEPDPVACGGCSSEPGPCWCGPGLDAGVRFAADAAHVADAEALADGGMDGAPADAAGVPDAAGALP